MAMRMSGCEQKRRLQARTMWAVGARIVLATLMLLAVSGHAWAQRPTFRKLPPEGVIEHTGLGFYSLVELKDGTLLADNGRVSTDGGKTWSPPRPLVEGATLKGSGAVGKGLLRLKSGALAFSVANRIWFSRDEGKSWSGPGEVTPQFIFGPYYFGDEMIQLRSGRLLHPFYVDFSGEHPELKYEHVVSMGSWKGRRYAVEGHGHFPEVNVVVVAYSDDEGKTWSLPKNFMGQVNPIIAWFDAEGKPTGHRGVTGFGEPTIAETKDGRVLMFARPLVNRVVYSYSNDGGETWSAVLPTELATSLSPARLERIPKTGDLMVVWNQVSKEEVQRGYRRGRLSVAISKDSGATWENFKTLEVSEGLDDAARMPLEYPIKMVRARDWVGQLPEGFATFDYANVCFAGDKVYITYFRSWLAAGNTEDKVTNKGEQVLRIYPLEWFYQ